MQPGPATAPSVADPQAPDRNPEPLDPNLSEPNSNEATGCSETARPQKEEVFRHAASSCWAAESTSNGAVQGEAQLVLCVMSQVIPFPEGPQGMTVLEQFSRA